jgi:FkbM family methyltransferase
MLIFDIGANIGAWAIANSSNDTIIVSVEASPSTFTMLVRNVASNKNIIPLHFAISCSDVSSITFYHCISAPTISTLDKDWLSSPESRFGSYKNSIKEIIVPTRSLDTLIIEYGMPDLIKIDVEGAEEQVLRSLHCKVPILCFEWAAEWKEKNLTCISLLSSLGYTEFDIQHEDNYKYRPSVFTKSADDIRIFFNHAIPKKDWGMIWAK